MEACPFQDNYAPDCSEEIPQITYSQAATLRIHNLIGEGEFGKVYLASLSGIDPGIDIAIKHIYIDPDEPDRYDIELCDQNRAGKLGLAPVVFGYWLCRNPDYGVIAMEYIKGMSFRDYILARQPHPIKIYLEIIRRASYQQQTLGISHLDLSMDNIIIEGERIVFLDYGVTQEYPSNQEIIDFLNSNQPNTLHRYQNMSMRIFDDFVDPTTVFSKVQTIAADNEFAIPEKVLSLNPPNADGELVLDPCIAQMSQLLFQHRLHTATGWFIIYKDFYNIHRRLPSPDELRSIIKNKIMTLLE